MTDDDITAMRKVLPVLLLCGLAGCGAPARWEKAGVSEQVIADDMVDCRKAAQQEAFRSFGFNWGFPYYGPAFWGRAGRTNWLMWQAQLDSDRFYAENRLTAFCMRNKGYELVPIPPPQTRFPQTPPAPDQ
jgi:hypothetical protein